MGMVGTYVAIDEEQLELIIDGEEDIMDIDPDENETLEIDKSWMAIHFLLCGKTDGGKPPMGYVVPMREKNELDCDMEYGAFYCTSEQVREASDYLSSLGDDDIKKKYDYKKMLKKGVYPLFGEDDDEDAEEFYEYVHDNLVALRDFLKQTAEKGLAVVFAVT